MHDDGVAKRHECCLIRGSQVTEHRGRGLAQPRQPRAGHTRAHIESKYEVERNLLEAHQVDALEHAIVADLEVVGTEPCDWTTALRHQHVDAHGLGP